MKYSSQEINSVNLSGTHVDTHNDWNSFIAWQPSTWPDSNGDPQRLIVILRKIFEESILNEINNVISDAEKVNGGIDHRGHVIALAMLCAVDTLSSYGFDIESGEKCPKCSRGSEKIGPRYQKYIEEFFPNDYKPYALRLYGVYRTSLTHSWNLFGAALTPNNDPIKEEGKSVSVGILNFREALEISIENFLTKLAEDGALQKCALNRFDSLRKSAVS